MELKKEYKETDFGRIPFDWESVPLGDVCEKIQDGNYGESYPRAHEFVNSGVPFLTSKAIGKDGVLKNHLIDFITTDKHNELQKAHLSLYDVLFTNRGASVGAIGFVDESISNGNIGPQLTFLRANKEMLEPLFLFQTMKSVYLKKQIIGQDAGSAMNFFGIGSTKKFQIPLPPTKAEQTAIATALSDADALISSLEKLIEKKRNIKQGAMQELLKPKKGWVVKKLGEIAVIKMGQSPLSIYYNKEGIGLPLIQGNADVENRKTIVRSFTSVTTKKGEVDDIIMSVRAPVGEIAKATFDCCLGRGVCSIKYKNEYIYHYLIYFEKSWARFSTGSTFDSVNSTQVKELEIPLPTSEEEQKQIATVLSDMDNEIASLEKKLSKSKMLKQGMMQELLTGKIRLV